MRPVFPLLELDSRKEFSPSASEIMKWYPADLLYSMLEITE